jgi:hypothetical protein
MGRAILAVALCALLAACATPPKPEATVTVACLPIPDYSAQFETDLTAAVAALPPTSPLIVAMSDLITLRAQDRACQASNLGFLK